MSNAVVTSTGAGRRRAGGGVALRAGVWGMHVVVVTLAVGSLVTNRFDVWIDLRLLGSMSVFFEILWVAATLLVPICAGPRLAGLFARTPRWELRGFAPAWGLHLLWPTYFVIACLVANSVYYLRLLMLDRADRMIPLPLVAAVLLGAWSLLTREWVRRTEKQGGTRGGARGSVRVTRWTHLRAGTFGVLTLVFMGSFLLIHAYARPPHEPVDVAVVLGGLLKEDGTASNMLRDRVLAAVRLYRAGLVRHIRMSGMIGPPKKPDGIPYDELTPMRQVALDAGIPESAISIDPVGVNTRATAYNTREFMRERGYSSVVACSTDFHLYRTALAFREMGIEAYTFPAQPADWRCASIRDTVRDMAGVVVYRLNPHYREPLAVSMKIKSPQVVVKKSAKVLELYDSGALVKTYSCISGGNAGDKEVEGDRKTPIGKFKIVFKNPASKFHLSLGLDYPNREDAERGLARGLITKKQYADILEALGSDLTREENQKKLWYTPLGGEIFLHGHGEGRSGTAGCVALSNPDIEELFAVLPLGTPVEIRE
jgi:uncharacterized SAM-binding protein YcdF (DUF218 family)